MQPNTAMLSGKIHDGQRTGKAAKKNGGFLIRDARVRGHSNTGQSEAAMTDVACPGRPLVPTGRMSHQSHIMISMDLSLCIFLKMSFS